MRDKKSQIGTLRRDLYDPYDASYLGRRRNGRETDDSGKSRERGGGGRTQANSIAEEKVEAFSNANLRMLISSAARGRGNRTLVLFVQFSNDTEYE